jgi:hypothetical protein
MYSKMRLAVWMTSDTLNGVEGSLDHGLLPLRGDRPRSGASEPCADTLLDLVDRNVADTPFFMCICDSLGWSSVYEARAAAAALLFCFSAAISVFAAGPEECGFCPVINRPSLTT